MGEKARISIRNIRREANEELKKKLKDKTISEDQSKNFEKNIQKLTDTNIENIEKILSLKEKRDYSNMNKLNHIAFIMDGNGRWGRKKNKGRNYGHLKRCRDS